MNANEIKDILHRHKKYLEEDGGEKADFSMADLGYANFARVDLKHADFSYANLTVSNFCSANLCRADFYAANLRRSNLKKADLAGANLWNTNLDSAQLEGANLAETKLPSPQMVLMALWGELSDDLTLELMRYDAASHPNPTTFDKWANGGDCPYLFANVQRAARFQQKYHLWSPGPSLGAYELMYRVLEEKCIGWVR